MGVRSDHVILRVTVERVRGEGQCLRDARPDRVRGSSTERSDGEPAIDHPLYLGDGEGVQLAPAIYIQIV